MISPGATGSGFHLSYIERDYPAPETQGFDTAYMRALYQYGYEKAASGRAWSVDAALSRRRHGTLRM